MLSRSKKRLECRRPIRFSLFLAIHFVFILNTAPLKADLVWGVNGHPLTAYPGISLSTQLDYVRDLGLSYYRVDISSTSQLPMLEKLVAKARKRKISILPVLTPSYDYKFETKEELYAKSYAFAKKIINRLKNDIRVWELGNELENYAILKPCEMRDDGTQYNCAWGPASGASALDYHGARWAKVSAILKGLSEGAKAVDPQIRKAMGTAGWGHVGAFERMKQDGIEWDISIWHHYEGKVDWGLKQVALYGKPIWITEFNHSGGSAKGVLQQATGLGKTVDHLRSRQKKYNIEAAFVYELLDETYWAPSFEAHMGLVHLKRTMKKTWVTAQKKPAYCLLREKVRGGYKLNNRQAGRKNTAPSLPARNCNLCLFDHRDVSNDNKIRYGYCLALGRSADGGGLSSWLTQFDKGLKIEDFLLGMLRSREFEVQHKIPTLNNNIYVKLMYRLLLNRDADSHGLKQYVNELSAGKISRDAFVKSLLFSHEFQSTNPMLFHPSPKNNTASIATPKNKPANALQK